MKCDRFQWLAVVWGALLVGQGSALATEPAALDRARNELNVAYAAKLGELAAWCDQQGLVEPARQVRGWQVRPEPLCCHVFTLPETTDPPPPATAPAAQRQSYERFQTLRKAQADALFELARRAMAERRATLAFGWAAETVRENPDHEAARRILGYQRYEGRWLTSYEASKARSKQVWHDKYGWLLAKNVPRYEAGERFVKARWTSAEVDAQAHRDIANGWTIDTEHFQLLTNHSLEEGVRLAGRLERLYRVWQQLFVTFYVPEATLARWFQGATPEPRVLKQRHKVVYYRDRDQYIAALRPRQPRIEITTGYYEPDSQTAYFFAGSEQGDGNVFHEATHQLFAETRSLARPFGREANFWITEGIACYMESLVERDGFCRVGGADAVRLRDARFRLVEDQFFLPLAELVALSMAQLQADERISMIYSESSGLTYFLMHAGDGRYREVLVDYLAAVYSGRDRPTTLAELAGAAYPELDREYRQFIEGLKP